MAKEPKKKRIGTSKDHDFTVLAREVVEKAIGEKLDGSPLDEAEKDSKLVNRARKAGKVGGKKRAKKLTPEKRSEIARLAAAARWKKG